MTTVLLPDHPKRLAFARFWKNPVPNTKLYFSDEKMFVANDLGCRTQFVRPGEAPLPRQNSRWPSSRLMAWMVIGPGFKHLVIFSAKERLNAETYISKCLGDREFLQEIRQEGAILQQDGAACHRAAPTKLFIRKMKIDLMEDWPPRSPDLNPCELAWSVMQSHVTRANPVTEQELQGAILAAFASLTLDYINRLIQEFYTRCARIVALRGAPWRP